MQGIQAFRSTLTSGGSWAGTTRQVALAFDDAGRLSSATLERSGSVAFPVPLPPGVGGFEVPLGTKVLDVADPALQRVAERIRAVASSDVAGGVNAMYSMRGGRYVTTTAPGQQVMDGVFHLPGSPTRVDAKFLGSETWPGYVREAPEAVQELAALTRELHRIA